MPRLLGIAACLAVLAMPAPASASTQFFALGGNQFGELGTPLDAGTTVAHRSALSVDTGRPGKVVQVSAGQGATLVRLDDGSVLGFGLNQFGELGVVTNNRSADPNPTPIAVPFAGTAVDVSTSGSASFIVTGDGTLLSFGLNVEDVLGRSNNAGNGSPNFTPTAVTLPGATGVVTQVSAGNFHTLALTAADELYAFGDGRTGALGTATGAVTFTPVRVTLPGESGHIVQIAAGASYSLALTSTGQVFSWGNNRFGELGTASNVGVTMANPTPGLVGLPAASGTPVRIAAGGEHSLVLTSTGKVFAFGRNTAGELGLTADQSAHPVPTQVALPEPATAISASTRVDPNEEDSLVLLASGKVFGFGANAFGQTGGPGGVNATPVQIALPGPAAAIGAGETQTLIVPDDRPVVTPTPTPAPTPVATSTPAPAPAPAPVVPAPAAPLTQPLAVISPGITAPKHLDSVFALLSWNRRSSGRTELTKLSLAGLAKGDRVALTCSGKGCPKRVSETARARTLVLTSKVRHKQLRPGAKLVITVSRKGFLDSVTTYTAIAHKDPRKAVR